MATLGIPRRDVETLIKLIDIDDQEFKSVFDKVKPNTIYINADLNFDDAFNGSFSNGVSISEVVGVLARAINSAASYSFSVERLIKDIRSSIQSNNRKLDDSLLASLDDKIRLAYQKFFYSGLALDTLTSSGNTVTEIKLQEDIKPIFDNDDKIQGYVFSIIMNISYNNGDQIERISLNLDHMDAEFLLYSVETALKRKGELQNRYRSMGENVFSFTDEGEYYGSEG